MSHVRTKTEDLAYVTGHSDGWEGNSYLPRPDGVPEALADAYASEYYRGYYDGQLAYRRTVQ